MKTRYVIKYNDGKGAVRYVSEMYEAFSYSIGDTLKDIAKFKTFDRAFAVLKRYLDGDGDISTDHFFSIEKIYCK